MIKPLVNEQYIIHVCVTKGPLNGKFIKNPSAALFQK